MATLRQIAEIRREQRRPARVFEGTAQDYLPQIQGHLRAQGMAEHAALFAAANPLPDRLQWFTDLPGEIRRLDELAESEQRAVAARVAALVEDLVREAERLKADRNPSSRTLGEVLAVACEGPGTADIVLVGEQPVLAGWGLRPVDPAARPVDLLAELRAVAAPGPAVHPAMPAAATPAAAAPPVAAPPRVWPVRTAALAALVLALAAAIAWFLPGAVAGVMAALRLPEPAPCVPEGPPPDAPLAALQDEEARLRQQIAEAEGAIARRIVQCRLARAAAEPPRPPPPPEPPPRRAEAPPPVPPPRDDETERRLAREGARQGAVQVTLRWETTADLDLHVVCPTGATISYANPRACGGELDVDINVGLRRVRDPIENVTWPEGAAPHGTYRVLVANLGEASGRSAPVPFLVRIKLGERIEEVRGTARSAEPRQVARFTVP